MLFQSDWFTTDAIHKELQPSVTAWQEGKTAESFAIAETIRKKLSSPGSPGDLKPHDFLWLSEITSHCGLQSRSKALHYLAYKFFPDDFDVASMYAWDCSAFGHFYKCNEILDGFRSSGTDRNHVLKLALKVYNYSCVSWKDSAHKLATKIQELVGESGLIWYILSRASAKRTEWQRAIKEGKKAIRFARDWNYARAALVDPLIAVGDIETAKMVTDSFRPNQPDAYTDMSLAIFQETQGQVDQAIDLFSKIVESWPKKSHIVQFALRKSCLLLFQQGRVSEAEAIIKEHDFRFLKEKTKATDKTSRKYISVPLISQTTNHCVPTVAAMVAGAQGVEASAIDYAEGMNTRHGTQMWQMIEFMEGQDFTCFHIKPEIEIVKAILDKNIPVIGSISDVFSGHVDVLCGYDDQLQIFHVRDPMHWHPTGIMYESLKKKYEQSGGLFLLVSKENLPKIEIPDTWLNSAGKALTALSKACSLGDRKAAEEEYKKIPDDHPLAFNRNCLACHVVTTDAVFQKQLQETSAQRNEEGEVEMPQLQAMLRMINQENADRVYQEAKEFRPELGTQFLNYIKAQCQMAKLQWKDSYETLRDITKKWPSNETAWNLRSIVADQLGDDAESKRCLKIALEIAPESAALLSRQLRLDQHKKPYQERFQIAENLVQSHAGNPDVFFIQAEIHSESEDGLLYRKSLVECSKYYPRHPGAYRMLADWYLSQGRVDLAKKTNEYARKLIGEEEYPIESYEMSEAENERELERKSKELEQKLAEGSDVSKESTTSKDPASILDRKEEHQKQFTNLMDRLQIKINQTSWKEFSTLEETETLQRFFDSGELPWHESAIFTSMKIFSLLRDGAKNQRYENQSFIDDLERLLPRRVPGVPELFANAVLDRIETDEVPRIFQKRILEWIEYITNGLQTYAPLLFHKACLLEYLDKFLDSETVLKSILKSSPAYTPALYRLACIQVSRKNHNKGKQLFKKCLKISPGHYGSLYYLRYLADPKDQQGREKYSRRISMLYPFDDGKNLETAIDVGRSGDDLSFGLSYLRRRKERISENLYEVIQARYYLSFEQFSKAINTVKSIQQTKENELQVWWTLFDCYGNKENYSQANKLIDKILEKTPDDVDAIEAKAKVLSFLNEKDAIEYSMQQINKKVISPLIASTAIMAESNPYKKSLAIIQNAPKDFKEQALASFFEVLDQMDDSQQLLPFLEYCCKDYPKKLGYKASYAANLSECGFHQQAIKIAGELVDLQPENASYLNLAGYCTRPVNAKSAINYFEKAFSITGSIQTKLRIAETMIEANRMSAAKDLFYEVLSTDKQNDYVIKMLVTVFGDDSKYIFDCVCKSLEADYPIYETNFHLIAIDIANKFQKRVPLKWIDSAMRQAKYSQDPNETKELNFRIRQWFNKWKDKRVSEFGNWLTDIKIYFSKDRAWIPTRPYESGEKVASSKKSA